MEDPGSTPENQIPPHAKEPLRQAHTWGMLCHLSALLGFIGFPFGGFFLLPFGNLIGPLVVWLIKKDDHPYIDEQGKEALNFQISMTIYALLASIFVLVLIGFFLLIGLAICDVILVIIAAVKVSNGESFKYPATIRFIK